MFRLHKFYRPAILKQLKIAKTKDSLYYGASSYHSNSGVYGYRPTLETNKVELKNAELQNQINHSNIYRLIQAYRAHGHYKAPVDPLGLKTPIDREELMPEKYGLENSTESIMTNGLLYSGKDQMTVQEIINQLEDIYCNRNVSIELEHLSCPTEREWLAKKFEESTNFQLSQEEKVKFAKLMLKSEAFDHFLATKFNTVKRYGAEGGESAICFYDELFNLAANNGLDDVVICMAHRGRLNLLACLLEYPAVSMFRKMNGMREFPDDVNGDGDVLSHLTSSIDLKYGDSSIHCSMVPNPSHLEAVNPVAMGKTRAKEQSNAVGDYSNDPSSRLGDSALCLQIHGDAAFVGQGIVFESLALSNTPHFRIGGSVHFIINNQIGFTTEPNRGRSSSYSSCIAKMNGYPVLHVNSDSPSESQNVCSRDELDKEVAEWNKTLSENHDQMETYIPKANHLEKKWANLVQPSNSLDVWDTGLDPQLLKFIGARSVEYPTSIQVHPTLTKQHIRKRIEKLTEGRGLDWATAEALAIGSILCQGFNVRICGQDVGRGTFSHRHAMLVDQETDEISVPLNNIIENQKGFLEIANSLLSEEAVLAFEYGMSIENPNTLPIWEAQFGDFFNGAQIIIDTFISSGETKWLLQSGLTMLLPHGLDGAGPEHSSCRLERFLQLCDSSDSKVDGSNINMHIANPTTPAQYFHLLRRQMVRNYRKPLIMASPKILLRYPDASSSLEEFAPGTSFQPVLKDTQTIDPKAIKKIVFVCGKHFYALDAERSKRGIKDLAIIRLELRYAGRDVLCMPAVGVGQVHKKQVEAILDDTFS
ncbi:DgyrCDS7785 [Dimorphilus gyrociliatus]|uniref:DgyrCDS7785 n=1 Tax=Dimorphilus gyrociliatus TaxID=2664684 RepID=A0A7I8VTX1_9ANNE|nr:DgyrCDS7785 [Dimorphilus gyrociliatus]